jgi:hypothetical protein
LHEKLAGWFLAGWLIAIESVYYPQKMRIEGYIYITITIGKD